MLSHRHFLPRSFLRLLAVALCSAARYLVVPLAWLIPQIMRPVALQVRPRRPVVVLTDHQHGRNDTAARAEVVVFVEYDHEHRRPAIAVSEHQHALGWAIAVDDRDSGVFDLFTAPPTLVDREVVVGGRSLSEPIDRVVGQTYGIALAVGQRAGVVAGGVFGAHSPITTTIVSMTPMVNPYNTPHTAAKYAALIIGLDLRCWSLVSAVSTLLPTVPLDCRVADGRRCLAARPLDSETVAGVIAICVTPTL